MTTLTTAPPPTPTTIMKLNTFPCDDVFSNIISFLDFKSAIRFSKMTHPTIRNRIFSNDNTNNSTSEKSSSSSSSTSCSMMCFPSLWKDFYQRHLFAPPLSHSVPLQQPETLSNYYVDMMKHKQQLLDNLFRFKSSTKKSSSSLLSSLTTTTTTTSSNRRKYKNSLRTTGLPDSCYSFVPITPTTFTKRENDNESKVSEEYTHDDDPPPVDFACTSFIFTSSNTSSEMAYLDPYNGSLSIHENIMDYAICNNNNDNNDNNNNNNSISSSNKESKSIVDKKMYKSETLIDVQDYFDLDIQEYHNIPIPTSTTTTRNNSNSENEDVVIDWLGIDSHTIVDIQNNKYEQIGNMVCAARTIIIENPLQQGQIRMNDNLQQQFINMNPFNHLNNMRLFEQSNGNGELVVTEILAWKKNYSSQSPSTVSASMASSAKYGNNPYICRMEYSPYYIEICPTSNRVFTIFSSDTPIQMNSDMLITRACDDDHDTIMDANDGDFNTDDFAGVDDNSEEGHHDRSSEDNRIFIYPLLEKNNNTEKMLHSPNDENYNNGRKYFPNIQECIHCDDSVASFIVDPFGEHLIVGTERGTIEIWKVSQDNHAANDTTEKIPKAACRNQKISMSMELGCIDMKPNVDIEAAYSARSQQQHSDSSILPLDAYISFDRDETQYEHCFHDHNNDQAISPTLVDERFSFDSSSQIQGKEENGECPDLVDSNNISSIPAEYEDSLIDQLEMGNFGDNSDEFGSTHRGPLSLPECKPSQGFHSIEIASHLPLHIGGFVGVQHNHNEGTTLSYWHYQSEIKQFQLASLINLPLSPQPKPQVSFDGKRIVVFGQDHIGVIILVYKVLR